VPTCPICKKVSQDILKHLRLSHDITGSEQYQVLLGKIEKREQRKREFGDFVRHLQEQRREGSISAEQYRESIEKWMKDHEEE
jgi:hypothetical protein